MFVNKLGKAELKFRRRNVGDAGSIKRNRKTTECRPLNWELAPVPPTKLAFKRVHGAASRNNRASYKFEQTAAAPVRVQLRPCLLV